MPVRVSGSKPRCTRKYGCLAYLPLFRLYHAIEHFICRIESYGPPPGASLYNSRCVQSLPSWLSLVSSLSAK